MRAFGLSSSFSGRVKYLEKQISLFQANPPSVSTVPTRLLSNVTHIAKAINMNKHTKRMTTIVAGASLLVDATGSGTLSPCHAEVSWGSMEDSLRRAIMGAISPTRK